MIEIRNVTKRYGKSVVLENLSYNFKNSGITCLLGASGCGKTTLLNLLAGFDTDYDGEIYVCGENIGKLNPSALCEYRKNNTGFIFQDYNLIGGYSVLENILFAAELNNKSDEENKNAAVRLIEQLGIDTKANEKVENLSGGQKQRVAIARALINDPKIIFADEPTGALDRTTATEIMKLLKTLSKERLVVVITHDKKICDFADEVISIVDGKLEVISSSATEQSAISEKSEPKTSKPKIFKRAARNFKNHIGRYVAVALAVAIGISAFALSLSSQNIVDSSIEKFKEKNTSFQNGFVRLETEESPLEILKADNRVEHIFYQYVMENIDFQFEDQSAHMDKKVPIAMSGENMVLGVMPRYGENEIVLSPSVAKKLSDDLESLIGKQLTFSYNGKSIQLNISGIFNAMYDDFILSVDAEEKLYGNMGKEKPFSVSYDVKEFTDVMPVTLMLKDNGFIAETAANEVESLQKTFDNLKMLFMVVSVFILAIGLFVCIMLLIKLMNTRYHEVGLMSALGYSRSQINKILTAENMLLSALAVTTNIVVIGIAVLVARFGFQIEVLLKPIQILLSVLATFIAITAISGMASIKLIRTEPAEALKK